MPDNAVDYHDFKLRDGWVDRRAEAALDPDRPIIDPHHHLWDRPGFRYLLPELLSDLDQGHRIDATVFIQCRAMHRAAGPEAFRPVGETEFVNGVAAMSASGQYGPSRVAAGIVGHANLLLGADVRPVLEAHMRAGGDRFRGIRHITVWDEDETLLHPAYRWPRDIFTLDAFRTGFAELARHDLSFDAWLYHPQITDLAGLARVFPQTTIVLDHLGGPLGVRDYAGRKSEVFDQWRDAIRELATCDNVVAKLGGLGMPIIGQGFDEAPEPPSSDDLAAAWRPWFETAIESFGPGRCMFESNFPVDKMSYGYGVFWNACKKVVSGASEAEKSALFFETAARVYRIQPEPA